MIILYLSCLSSEPETNKSPTPQSPSSVQKPLHPPHQGAHHSKGGHHQGGHHGGPKMGQQKSFSVEPTYSWTGTASKEPKSIVLISLDTVRAYLRRTSKNAQYPKNCR